MHQYQPWYPTVPAFSVSLHLVVRQVCSSTLPSSRFGFPKIMIATMTTGRKITLTSPRPRHRSIPGFPISRHRLPNVSTFALNHRKLHLRLYLYFGTQVLFLRAPRPYFPFRLLTKGIIVVLASFSIEGRRNRKRIPPVNLLVTGKFLTALTLLNQRLMALLLLPSPLRVMLRIASRQRKTISTIGV